MHVDLLSTTKGSPKIIHGTENGKKTACGINLTKPENIGMFTNAGQMNDVVQMTCEKCKTVIAKHLIRESNKEFAAQLKEEQRQLKRERAAAKHHTEAAVPPPVSSAPGSGSSDGYVPPSMRKQTPPPRAVDTTSPIPAPAPMPSPVSSAPNDVLAQFAVPSVPTSLPNMSQPASVPVAQSADDVLAQFAVPSVPSSLPSMSQPASVPVAQSADDVLAQFAVPSVPSSLPGMNQPASVPVAQSADDVLAQFAVPSVPTSLPSMNQPASVPVAQSADDVLAQFAVPSVPSSLPSMNQPASVPVAQSADDVLAQFAVPSVPTSLPSMSQPTSVPVAQSADDVLAQFAVPSVPTSLPSMSQPASVPAAQSADDVLAQFAVPSVPSVPDIPDVPSVSPVSDSVDDVLSQFTVPSAPKPSIVSGSSVNQDDILAQFASMQPNIRPYDDRNDDISSDVSEQASTLDDLLILPAGQQNHSDLSSLPDIANVPTSIPTDSIGGMVQSAIPELNVPQAPPAPPIPAMPVPPSQQTAAVSTLPQNMSQIPAQQQFNPFAVPTAPKAVSPSAPMPLFVGYSADGRQLFQTYDEVGNPIPINEPVYSTPPEQKGNDLAIRVAAMASNASMRGNAPIMDMDEIMASMGIADPSKPKKEEGKAINFTEYKIPQEKDRKKKPVSRPASAIASPVPDGPVSAAEAKRRKKVDKINKEFEKQLRSRGIDPKTGGIMIDPRK